MDEQVGLAYLDSQRSLIDFNPKLVETADSCIQYTMKRPVTPSSKYHAPAVRGHPLELSYEALSLETIRDDLC